MEHLIMMSNSSNKKLNSKNRVTNEPSNLFLSWNKGDNFSTPLKIQYPSKSKFISKNVSLPEFPILEDNKKCHKRYSNSFKLINKEEDSLIYPQMKGIEKEQTKVNILLPKINTVSSKSISVKTDNKKRKSFSYFKDNTMNMNNNNYIRKNSFEKKIIKNYFAASQAGKNSDGDTKTNQDSFLVLLKINNLINFNVFAVFDGHGSEGHLVSQFLVKYFTDFFNNDPQIKKCQNELEVFNLLLHSNYKILREAIITSELKLREEKDINSDYSGSTCCMIIQIYQKIICANVGDSRAILLSEMIKEDIIPLSNDHKPNLKKELERIKRYGGVVEKCIDEFGIEDGPFRVWNNSKQEYPGLAVSRSIGDIKASKLGVLAEPEFNLKTLKNNMKYIVIASDGIWEYLTNKNVCKIIKRFYAQGDAKAGAEELVKIAGEKWAKEGDSADDITTIVIFL